MAANRAFLTSHAPARARIGAAAALWAAAEPGAGPAAVVSRGGRPDLARPRLAAVTAWAWELSSEAAPWAATRAAATGKLSTLCDQRQPDVRARQPREHPSRAYLTVEPWNRFPVPIRPTPSGTRSVVLHAPHRGIGSWTGSPHDPSAAGAASAMNRAICAASACAAREQAPRKAWRFPPSWVGSRTTRVSAVSDSLR
jgi:hypothetical protein